ncbi:MAG: sensor histidine kinase [Acidimicrobiales bacterium]
MPVTLLTDGDLTTVPAGVSLAAYRIVQEAFTNVVRHAGTATVTVTIRVVEDRIELTIDDDGRGPATPGFDDAAVGEGRNGLLGMSERARMYEGDVHAGPRPGGGFRVRATLCSHTAAVASGGPGQLGTSLAPEIEPKPGGWRLSPAAMDVLLAGLLVAISSLEAMMADSAADAIPFTPLGIWAIALRLGTAGTLVFRRRHPTTGYAVAWALGLALVIGNYQFGVLIFVLWIGLYSVGA